jgi:PAS domain S-box-containing protein
MPKRQTTRRRVPRPPQRTRLTAAASTPSIEQPHRLVIEAIAEGVYEWSADTRQLKVSDRLNKMLGFEKGELTSGRWLDRIHPDDRHRLRNETIHYFKGEVPPVNTVFSIRPASGAGSAIAQPRSETTAGGCCV